MPYVLLVVKQNHQNAKIEALQSALKATTQASSTSSQTVASGVAIVLSEVVEINRGSIVTTAQQVGYTIIEGPTVSREPPKLEPAKIYTVRCTVRPDTDPYGLNDYLKRETGAVEVTRPPAVMKGTREIVLVGITDLQKTSESNLARLLVGFDLTLDSHPYVLEGIHPSGIDFPFQKEEVKRILEQIRRQGGGSFRIH